MLHVKYVRHRTLLFSNYTANAKLTAMSLNVENERVAVSTQSCIRLK